jgi:hypothetical protein
MTNDIVVAGMHRTGHHPIAIWLLHQQPHIHEFAIQTIAPWLFQVEGEDGISILANNPLKRGRGEHPDKKKFDSVMLEKAPHRIILTHEQETISNVAKVCASSRAVWRNDNKPTMVIVLRDFKNWVASCIKMAYRDDKPVEEIINKDKIKIYQDHFRYVYKNLDGIHYILYNQWVKSSDYRREVCELLGLTFTDAAIDQLSIFGGGSSFDGMKYIKTACNMDTGRRYKEMEDNPYYKVILQQHNNVLSLSNEVFGKYI